MKDQCYSQQSRRAAEGWTESAETSPFTFLNRKESQVLSILQRARSRREPSEEIHCHLVSGREASLPRPSLDCKEV
ncbi:hypothetical protein KOW79_021113 [Hemibagrus wyckioides]|uniref:Uncharacterized protein n=1 Tax=Hemibagrus wyckioides TaxID=337641 RepID=A0A9D3N3R2_9TELE|nr:hypothetical protein KOW79_021113 [Hemibagrus wyckioides]